MDRLILGKHEAGSLPLLSRLPASRIAPAVEARDYHDPMLLRLEEYAIRKAPHPGAATVPVDGRELRCMFRDCLNRRLRLLGRTAPKFWTDVVVPSPRFQQILIGLWGPDDWECHGFLNRAGLTCCHGMTSEGFCSCRAMR